MSEHNEEIHSLRNVLGELTELAEGASLTGMLNGGQGRAVSRFNAIASRLVELGAIQKSMYQPLPGDAGYADVAIEARLLAAQLAPTKNKHKHEDNNILMRLAPFVDSQDLAELVREQMRKGSDIDMHQLSSLAPFLDRGMLGELLRTQMSSSESKVEPAATPQPQPQPQAPPASHLPVAGEQEPKPEDLLELLKNPHLTDGERQELVQRLTASVS
ncbi:MAG: hypothetical protein ACAH95_03635 [Fimbriimonas sp.]